MNTGTKIKGVKLKKQWAAFSPDGYIQCRTISDTQKEAKERTPKEWGNFKWADYAAEGYTTNKILLDIKIF